MPYLYTKDKSSVHHETEKSHLAHLWNLSKFYALQKDSSERILSTTPSEC